MFEVFNHSNNHIVNSTITGRVDITRTANSSDGTYVNSTLYLIQKEVNF
jgi:hypothetical protein